MDKSASDAGMCSIAGLTGLARCLIQKPGMPFEKNAAWFRLHVSNDLPAFMKYLENMLN
ncbi:hypothetical protein [Dyadobacter sediminis]|uniref:hypothetical protein n=1 Tax=Dyadobacter sediminis TaxID=1493691 RepID=UPI00148724DE|nr:hypothetical protein [Dyadobacter sediminis]